MTLSFTANHNRITIYDHAQGRYLRQHEVTSLLRTYDMKRYTTFVQSKFNKFSNAQFPHTN
jgi:hypothetical protein